MTSHLFFLAGFCLLLTHEMDAVRLKEWRMFPVLSGMREEAAYLVFTALHVPLYALLFWGLFGGSGMNLGLIVALDVFFIIHAFLHLFLRKRPNHLFASGFSWALSWAPPCSVPPTC